MNQKRGAIELWNFENEEVTEIAKIRANIFIRNKIHVRKLWHEPSMQYIRQALTAQNM
jgi:hypothetical protein